MPIPTASVWPELKEHYIMNCVADVLFLAIRNYHIELLTKNKTDVDATGRYIHYRGYQICMFYLEGNLRA